MAPASFSWSHQEQLCYNLLLRRPFWSKQTCLLGDWPQTGRSCEIIVCCRVVDLSGDKFQLPLLSPRGNHRLGSAMLRSVRVLQKTSQYVQVVSEFASRLLRSTPAAPNLESPGTFAEAADARLCFIISPAHSRTTLPSRRPISCSRA